YQRNAAETLPAGMAPSTAASRSSRMPSFNGRRPDSMMLKQHGHFSASRLITARIALWLIALWFPLAPTVTHSPRRRRAQPSMKGLAGPFFPHTMLWVIVGLVLP